MRRARTPILVDVLLAAALAGLSVATVVRGDVSVPWLGVVLAVLAVAPVAVRQVAPVTTLLVVEVALVAWVLLGYGDWPSGALGMVIGLFTVATVRGRRVTAAAFPTTVGVLVFSGLRLGGVTWTMVLQAVLVCAAAWALGEATRRWARGAEEAAALAERSVAEERARIARELHDVVTHHLSVVALQTGLADYVLDADPATARVALGHAGAAGREALQDLGRMLGALRTEVGAAPYDPQPGLADVDGLVERLRASGLQVTVTRTGSPRPVPPGLGLCAYRVVQEALTNVLKHAGPAASAHVVIEHGDRVLAVEVSDDGDGPATQPTLPALPTRGHGVRGMRERTELYGGVLDAGPRAGGGWRVSARLPLAEALDTAPVPAGSPDVP